MRRNWRAWTGVQRDARLEAGGGGEGGASYLQGPVVCLAWGEGAGGGASVTLHIRRWVSRVSECGLQEAGTQRRIWVGHLAKLSARGSQ